MRCSSVLVKASQILKGTVQHNCAIDPLPVIVVELSIKWNNIVYFVGFFYKRHLSNSWANTASPVSAVYAYSCSPCNIYPCISCHTHKTCHRGWMAPTHSNLALTNAQKQCRNLTWVKYKPGVWLIWFSNFDCCCSCCFLLLSCSCSSLSCPLIPPFWQKTPSSAKCLANSVIHSGYSQP